MPDHAVWDLMVDWDSMRDSSLVPQIAVIGGGITGLAAAVTLRQTLPQAKVTLFEGNQRLGGALWTKTETLQRASGEGSFLIEQGADSFLVDDPATLEFLERADCADDLIPTAAENRRAFVLHNGKLLPTPAEFALLQPRKLRPLLTTPLLSLSARLRAAAEFLIRSGEVDEESLADFARRRFGHQVYDRLIEPLVAGIFTADGEKLSLQAALPKFAAMEQEHGSLIRAAWKNRKHKQSDETLGSGARYGKFVTPRGGFSSLVERLVEQLPGDGISLGSQVTALDQRDAKWAVRCKDTPTASDSDEAIFDAVIVTTPSAHACTMLESVDKELARLLGQIEAASSVVVSFAFCRADIRHPLDGFGFVVPRTANRPLLAASFPSVKFPGRAPDDCVLIRTFLGGALRPEFVDLPDEELRKIAQAEISEILGISGQPLFVQFARWRNAMPQYHLGHLERVRKIENRAADVPGLSLGGNYLHGVGIPQCVRSGVQAASQVVAFLNKS